MYPAVTCNIYFYIVFPAKTEQEEHPHSYFPLKLNVFFLHKPDLLRSHTFVYISKGIPKTLQNSNTVLLVYTVRKSLKAINGFW